MYMKLNEFLENNIPAYKLLDVLFNNEDLIVDFYDVDAEDLPKNNSRSDLVLDKETVVKAITDKNMKMTEFDKILQKYLQMALSILHQRKSLSVEHSPI